MLVLHNLESIWYEIYPQLDELFVHLDDYVRRRNHEVVCKLCKLMTDFQSKSGSFDNGV